MSTPYPFSPNVMYRVIQWYASGDTGLSSHSIVVAAMQLDAPTRGYNLWKTPHIPHDSGDLGRCIRLLEKVPELRYPAFKRLGAHSKEWRRLLPHWDQLVECYHEELEIVEAHNAWAPTVPFKEAEQIGIKSVKAYPMHTTTILRVLNERPF